MQWYESSAFRTICVLGPREWSLSPDTLHDHFPLNLDAVSRDNIGMPGLAKYFKDGSDEERDHAQLLITFQVLHIWNSPTWLLCKLTFKQY